MNKQTLTRSKKIIFQFLVYSSLLFLIACDQNDDLAGGSTDVETGGISGVAKIAGDSIITEGTTFILTQLNNNLLADSISSTTADEFGKFKFTDLEPGNYSIESYQRSSGKRNLNSEIQVQSDSLIHIESIMHTPGSIEFVGIPDSLQNSDYSLYIPHLRLQKSLIENTSSITIDSIPAGVEIEIRLEKSLIYQGLIANTLLSEGQDTTLTWP